MAEYTAHAKQSEFHHALRTHTDILFAGGRGSGKTTAGAIASILEACEYQPGERGIITAPTYPMLEDATMYEFFKWLPRRLIKDFNKQRRLLTLLNNSEIAFRSCDNPDSLRGPNRAWAWMDEPRNVRNRDAFDILSAQLRPTRRMLLTTTPSGIFHWIYTLFFEKPLPNSYVVTVRTAENPYLPESYAQTLRSQYTGAFAAQELDAQWVSFEGLIYDNLSHDNISEAAEYDPGKGAIYWGADDGYARGDGPGHANYHPRVVLQGQITSRGDVHIFDENYHTLVADYQESWRLVFEKGYPRPELAYTLVSDAMLRGGLSQASIMNAGVKAGVSAGIKNVRRLVEDGNGVRRLLIHPRCTNLIRELQSYRRNERASVATAGEIPPLKVDDHGPDALRYLCDRQRLQQ